MDLYLSLLSQFLSFKSISTDPQYADEVSKAAQWLHDLFSQYNFKSEIITGYGHPIVYAEYIVDSKFETVLVYGHYDVQPADKADGWENDPFDLTEKDGRLYGRGVVDNKGQTLIHIVTVLDLIKEGKLKYNVKFLIEGDEETGSEGVTKLFSEQVDKFDSDYALISDGEMPYQPVITASFRGIIDVSVRYQTANNNLHSGLFGGAVPNAAEEMTRLIAKINNEENYAQIPEFYRDDVPPTSEEVEACNILDPTQKSLMSHIGIKKFFNNVPGKFPEKVGFHSMVTVTGLQSGYTGEGFASIIPNLAEAKFNFRLAANQKAEEVYHLFKKFVEENTPDYVSYQISPPYNLGDPIKIDISSTKHQETIQLLSEVYQQEVLIDYCGAIIFIVADIKKNLAVEPILVSLANDDCNMHGVDENFDMELIEKGLEFSKLFFST